MAIRLHSRETCLARVTVQKFQTVNGFDQNCFQALMYTISKPGTAEQEAFSSRNSDSGDDDVGSYWLSSNCASFNDHVSEDDME